MEGDPDFRPWNELIPDVLGLIFSKLKGPEVLRLIPLVCKSWCKVVEGPYCWKRIDTGQFVDYRLLDAEEKVEQVLRALLPRTSRSLRELCVSWVDDHMLSFIAEHTGCLETLDIGISLMSESMFEQFASQLGSLTTLVIRSNYGMSPRTLQAISQNCKRLVSLSWEDNIHVVLIVAKLSYDEDESFMCSMPNLKRLSLNYTLIKESHVVSLLSGCPKLEWVEIRCLNPGHTFDASFVKEKCPDIVTLALSWESGSDSDDYGSYSDGSADYSDYYENYSDGSW